MGRKIISDERYRKILDEIDESEDYNFFKEVISFMHTDPRMLIQTKCIEIHKWILGEKLNRDVDWKEAGYSWVDLGYAEKFADFYDEDETPKHLYNKIQKSLDKESESSK